jgi:anti-anti-sigma factor
MRFRLWGTRGSIPSPLRTEEIEAKIRSALSAAAEAGVDLSDASAVRAFIASLPHHIRGTAGGDTACLEVRSGGNLFIFDCGSGIRRLGLELMKEEFGRGKGTGYIFICHTHWDHMIGWPFFVPGFIPGNRFLIHGVHPDLEERFRILQTAPSMFPQPLDYQASDIQFVTLPEGDTIEIGQTRISNIRFHHPGGSYGYRIEDGDGILIYAGDSEYKTLDPVATQHYVEFFRDADALIFDAMFSWRDAYRFEDWGHSSAVAGVDLAVRAGVRRLLLFHHAPASTDEEIWRLRDYAEEYLDQHPERPSCEIIVGYDGLEMELWREARLEARPEHLPEGFAIHLSGSLVGETAPAALAAIEKAAAGDGNQPVVINLDKVAHMDREGLSALFSARRRWRPLALSGLSPELRRSLTRAGALDYFAIFDTPQGALEALKQGLDLQPGQLLGDRFRITEQLTRGPLGDLYRATDQAAHRPVTILIVCPSLGRLPTGALLEAAQTNTNLRHPLIADVVGAGQNGHITYVAVEYTPGRSIRQLLTPSAAADTSGTPADTPKSVPPSQAVHVGAQIAQALEYAHHQNIVHGALTPENVILSEDGSIKVTDFGIGRLEVDRPLSELPAYMGSPDYLAPEQLQGHGSSPSSDLYALGTILYEMLTGQPPFAVTSSDEDFIGLRLRQSPVPPRRRNPNLSRSLEHLVLNLLHKSRQERHSDPSVVRQVLNNLDPHPSKGPLVGRDALRQRVHHYLERTAQGLSGLLIVRGQRGIGKSRFIDSVTPQWVNDQPLIAMHGELFAYEDTRTYKLFTETLRPTLINMPAHRLSQLLDDLGDLSRPLLALIPELQPALSALAISEADCEDLEQAVCEAIRLMADQNPVVLILDGLQWIDIASLRLLDRLARQRIPRLLIVTLYRSEEVGPDHPLLQTLNALEPWIDEHLEVTALDAIDAHQMASTFNTQVPPDFGLWLYSETQGNPLYTEQLIQAYLEGPSEVSEPHDRARARTLEDVILRRLERLPRSVVITLRQAAVLGHTFHFDRLRAALDQPQPEVLANLESALRANFIVGHSSMDLYRFSHPLLREVIYTEMLGGVRKRYHRRAARALEQGGISSKIDEKIETLAYHFLQAGEHEQALVYLARATRRARQLCAHEAALNHVDEALKVVDELSVTAANQQELEKRKKQRNDLLNARARLEAAIAR